MATRKSTKPKAPPKKRAPSKKTAKAQDAGKDALAKVETDRAAPAPEPEATIEDMLRDERAKDAPAPSLAVEPPVEPPPVEPRRFCSFVNCPRDSGSVDARLEKLRHPVIKQQGDRKKPKTAGSPIGGDWQQLTDAEVKFHFGITIDKSTPFATLGKLFS